MDSPAAIPTLNTALPYVFGPYNNLFISVRVKDFLFDGLNLCDQEILKEGGFSGKIVCSQLRSKSEEGKGMLLLEDRIVFSYFYDVINCKIMFKIALLSVFRRKMQV